MITFKEMLHGHKESDITDDIKANMFDLLARVNVLRVAYGKPLQVTSGIRTYKDQARVNPHAMKSAHMVGKAIDIYDPEGEFKEWILVNRYYLEEQDLYCENFNYTDGWVHIQSRPVASGNRFFIP